MKSKLRHPVNSIREPFGTAGLIVAVIALVFALAGGAIAAAVGLNGKQKKEVTAIAKKFAGTPGAAGANGAAGSQGPHGLPGPEGPQGPEGPEGLEGLQGPKGINGTNGTNGKSVIAVAETPGANCKEGGASFEVEGSGTKHFACNGFGAAAILPSGVTETGTWAASGSRQKITTEVEGVKEEVFVGASGVIVPITFPIPLAGPLEQSHAHFVTVNKVETETVPADCTVNGVEGSVENPLAAIGLCVYEGFSTHNLTFQLPFLRPDKASVASGVGPTGTGVAFSIGEAPDAAMLGTWAVTAE